MKLLISNCSHEAAKHAVMNYHYSKRMPKSKLVKHGVWIDGNFVGAIVYGYGASYKAMDFLNLKKGQWAELVRVALNGKQKFPTSKILAVSIKKLKKENPGLLALVSYADQTQRHLGIIYQATNWLYFGEAAKESIQYHIDGKWTHNRTATRKYPASYLKGCLSRVRFPKYKYIYPLRKELRRLYKSKCLPYPKTCGRSDTSDTRSHQDRKDGATPILPLKPTNEILTEVI